MHPGWYKEMRPTRKCGIIFQYNHSGCSAVNELTLACRCPFILPVPLELLSRPPGLVITTGRCSFNWHGSCRCMKSYLFVLTNVFWATEEHDAMVLCYKGPQIHPSLFLEVSPLASSCSRRGDGGAVLLLSCTHTQSSWCTWLHGAGQGSHCSIPPGLPKGMQCGRNSPQGHPWWAAHDCTALETTTNLPLHISWTVHTERHFKTVPKWLTKWQNRCIQSLSR